MRILAPFRGGRPAIVGSLLALALAGGPAALAKGRKPAPKPDAQPSQQAQQQQQQPPLTTPTPAPTPQSMSSEPQGQAPAAQVPTTPENQLTNPSPLIHFQDVPTTRIGVDPANTVRLTLHDAVVMAVARNLGIEVSRFDVKSAEYNLFVARGAYDPSFDGEVSFQSSTFPVTRTFQGGGTDLSVSQKDLVYNFGVTRNLEHGGLVQANFNNTRSTTSATTSTLNPVYTPTLGVTVTQPLMRNFSFDLTRRQIEIAKKNLDLSDAQFRQQVIDTIANVQRAYWDLVFAIRNESIQRESVQLARVQLENNLKQVEAGTLAPIELRSTESDLEARKVQVIAALQSITQTENTLKNLLLADPGDAMWSAAIVPVDPADLVPVNADLQGAFRAALLNRPELDQIKLQTQLSEIDRRFYKNQLKPQVDLFGAYSLTGTAGTTSNILDPSGSLVPERFQGGYGRALGTLFSNDFKTYQVGVRFSFPMRNTVAEGNYGRTLAQLRQLDVRQRQLVQSIEVEVRNALQAVDAARQRYEAARASRVAAEAQLRGEEERFRAGLSTNFFVLDRQNQLSAARGSEAQALTDYNKAIVDLQRVTGTTMAANNVTVSNQPQAQP
jgi:HAE1 family hydrophobic/amphiphilic exporter-1